MNDPRRTANSLRLAANLGVQPLSGFFRVVRLFDKALTLLVGDDNPCVSNQ